jgi:hypothetical protein
MRRRRRTDIVQIGCIQMCEGKKGHRQLRWPDGPSLPLPPYPLSIQSRYVGIERKVQKEGRFGGFGRFGRFGR